MATQGRRRALGQHFLRDQVAAELIARTAVDLAREHGCVRLLEIGPGQGAITEPLIRYVNEAPAPQTLLLCERDPRLAHHWIARAQETEASRLVVHLADFLELPEAQWLGPAPLAVVSNLPYSSGTAIFTRLAAQHAGIPAMVLMFQAEVAQRLRAEPSTKAWGSLSVWTQNRWDVKKLLHVPPGAFIPPPQVDSEVVVLLRRAQPRIALSDPAEEALWQQLLKAAFQHRRKMLRSGLPRSGPIRNALELSQVDGTKRAEALSWEEWDRLFTALHQSPRA